MSTTTNRSAAHASFTIERDLPHPPAAVWNAFADPQAKAKWFGGGEWERIENVSDFQVGGSDVDEARHPNGFTSRFVSHYTDIVDGERIVYTYDMWIDGSHISTSVACITFEPLPRGATHLTVTEHGVYLDGFDDGSMRERGTRDLLDALERSLA